ncbi:MAG: hypothetical protein ABSF71_24085 [Terriglobia bacterium]|jgi:hypothetical protein
MEMSFGRASALLASILFGSLIGKHISPTYWGYVWASLLSVATFVGVSALWVLVRLPKLEFKDRRLNPVERKRIADYLRKFPKRQVWVVVTEAAKREDGPAFAAYIEQAIAVAWDVHEKDNQRANEADNFSGKDAPGHRFRTGVSVYGAKYDQEAKTILRDAFKKAKIDLYVDTLTGVVASMGYEDRIVIVVGLRETSLPN